MIWTPQRLLLVGQLRARGHSFAEIGERYGLSAYEMRVSYRGATKRAARKLISSCQDSPRHAPADTPTNRRTGAAA